MGVWPAPTGLTAVLPRGESPCRSRSSAWCAVRPSGGWFDGFMKSAQWLSTRRCSKPTCCWATTVTPQRAPAHA